MAALLDRSSGYTATTIDRSRSVARQVMSPDRLAAVVRHYTVSMKPESPESTTALIAARKMASAM